MRRTMRSAAHMLYGASAGLYVLMILLSILIAAYGFAFELRLVGSDDFYTRFNLQPIAGTMHVVGASIALLLGGFQFSSTIRARQPGIHRFGGRLYLLCVLGASLSGVALAANTAGGLVGQVGFGLLGVIWFYSALQAYVSIRSGSVSLHRRWMVRNFAMTFAAVTLRLQLGVLQGLDITFIDAYPLTAWLSWVPNLLVAEWILLRGETRKPIAYQASTSV